MMAHEYSKFKNKAIPYARVGRRVFCSLFNAETYCTENGLDVNSAIEYAENPKLKDIIQEVAKYQKAVLRECLKRIDRKSDSLKEAIDQNAATLKGCHSLECSFWEDQLHEAIAKHTAMHEAREIVWDVLEELEMLTGWHD